MRPEDLKKEFATLRAELEQLPENVSGSDKLRTLIDRLEQDLEQRDSEAHADLVDSVNRASAEFEIEHPQAAVLLRRLISALSSMGL